MHRLFIFSLCYILSYNVVNGHLSSPLWQDNLNIIHNNHHVINVQEQSFKIIAKYEEAYSIVWRAVPSFDYRLEYEKKRGTFRLKKHLLIDPIPKIIYVSWWIVWYFKTHSNQIVKWSLHFSKYSPRFDIHNFNILIHFLNAAYLWGTDSYI